MVDEKEKESEILEQDSLVQVDEQKEKEAEILEQDALVMVDAQQVKESDITEQDSLLLIDSEAQPKELGKELAKLALEWGDKPMTFDPKKVAKVQMIVDRMSAFSSITNTSARVAELEVQKKHAKKTGDGARLKDKESEAQPKKLGKKLAKHALEWAVRPRTFDPKKKTKVQLIVDIMHAYPSITNTSARVAELKEQKKQAEGTGDEALLKKVDSELITLEASLYKRREIIHDEPKTDEGLEVTKDQSASRKKWTLDEVRSLVEAVKSVGKLSWVEVKELMGSSRSQDHIKSKWKDLVIAAETQRKSHAGCEIPNELLEEVLQLNKRLLEKA
ncbi:unnamed protein product [Linum trigynum]|uniref:Myb-like domain-containing protein n=1 Tax=Linum trigynum TaxID=586398 RepID=A0AAV2FJY2_9ROSI